jgi:hypothetical protein
MNAHNNPDELLCLKKVHLQEIINSNISNSVWNTFADRTYRWKGYVPGNLYLINGNGKGTWEGCCDYFDSCEVTYEYLQDFLQKYNIILTHQLWYDLIKTYQ